jgi:anti-anti-sigma regulatory factor
MDPTSRRIELSGEYDLADRETLGALFRGLNPDVPAVIDMTNVTYVDSTMLHELAKLRIRFKRQSIKLLGCGDNLLRLLRLVDFEKLFEIVEASG